MILILGKSSLSKILCKHIPDAVVVGRPEYDLSTRAECERLVEDYTPTTVINTVALGPYNGHNSWDIANTNFTTSMWLTELWYKKLKNAHIINISSCAVYWPSSIDAPWERIAYNASKEALSNYCKHITRKIQLDHPNTVSVIEMPRFPSKMNNYKQGVDEDRVAQAVLDTMKTKYQSVSLVY